MIRLLVSVFCLNLCGNIILAQDDLAENRIYTSVEEALMADPDSVFHLDLSRSRLKEVPDTILVFHNLRTLDLSKNKLTNLPKDMYFKQLEVLNLTKNKFEGFPPVICKHQQLRQLFMGKNKLEALPACIGSLTELVVLDLWFNLIIEVPESIENLKKLQSFDLRGMNYSEDQQKKWQALVPWVKIDYDVGCDCGY